MPSFIKNDTQFCSIYTARIKLGWDKICRDQTRAQRQGDLKANSKIFSDEIFKIPIQHWLEACSVDADMFHSLILIFSIEENVTEICKITQIEADC